MIDVDALPIGDSSEFVCRAIPPRYRLIGLFERVSGPEDRDMLDAVRSLAHPTKVVIHP